MLKKEYKLKAGSIKRLQISEVNHPEPKAEEVTIKIKAIGLNFADIFAILGLYSATPKEAFVPGLEYSGEIIAVGNDVNNFKEGDRVIGITRFGAYTTHINTNPKYIIPCPDNWAYEEGSAYLVQVLTAYYGLINLGNLKENQTVLIHSAAGGVGIWANRIVKHFNGYTIGSIGNSNKIELLKTEGYDDYIVRNPSTFKANLQQKLANKKSEHVAKDSLEIIMECIGGKVLTAGYDLMSAMGRMVVYGSARYGRVGDKPFLPFLIWKFLTRPKIDPQNMTSDNKSVMAFNLIYLFEHIEIMHEILTDLKKMDLGKPIVGHTFTFEELPDAIRKFQTGKTTGKVVVTV